MGQEESRLNTQNQQFDFSLTKYKWEITIDIMMIIGKYLESSFDFINVMKLAKKFHDLAAMYHFNPINNWKII